MVKRIMEENLARQVQLMGMLSSTEEETVTRVEQLLEDKRAKEKEIDALNEKLCNSLAKSVLEDCEKNENVAVVDLGDVNMNFMMMLSNKILDAMKEENVMLLFLGEDKDDSDSGPFLLTGTAALVDSVGKKVGEILGGRGGGKNGRFQGKGTKLRSSLGDVKQLLAEVMKGAV